MIPPSKSELEQLREAGLTRKNIASQYGVSLSQVKRWISDLKVNKKIISKPVILKQRVKSNRLPDDAGMTVIERAKKILGPRLEMKRAGYFLDGRICGVDRILREAVITAKKVV